MLTVGWPRSAAELAAWAAGHGLGEVWITSPAVLAAWGLPAALAPRDVRHGVEHPWADGGSPLRGWMPTGHGRTAGRAVDIVIPAYEPDNPFGDGGRGRCGRAVLWQLERFAELVGVPWYRSGALTSDRLLREIHGGPGGIMPEWAAPPVLDAAGVKSTGVDRSRGGELDFHWRRDGRGVDRGETWCHAFDRNAAYLGAASSLTLGHGAPVHVGDVDQVARLDRRSPGYWLARVPPPVGPHLPDPCRPQGEPGELRWLTTPTLSLADELGHLVDVAEAWVWPEHHRPLEAWYRRLRDARAACVADERATAASVLAAVKATYKAGVGRLGSARRARPDADPLWQPHWRHSVIAEARGRLWRRAVGLVSFGRPAELIAVDVDCCWWVTTIASPDAWAEAYGLPLGDTLRDWRHVGTCPAGDAIDAIGQPTATALRTLRELVR